MASCLEIALFTNVIQYSCTHVLQQFRLQNAEVEREDPYLPNYLREEVHQRRVVLAQVREGYNNH